MRRSVFLLILLAGVLSVATSAAAQQKSKDPVLEQRLMGKLGEIQLNLETKLAALDQRLTLLEAELGKVKQAQADMAKQQNEAQFVTRDLQSLVKDSSNEVKTFRLQIGSDILGLQNGIGNLRSELAVLTDTVKRTMAGATGGSVPSPAPAQPAAQPAPSTPGIEGYITDVDPAANEVKISLGSNTPGIAASKTFGVYRNNVQGRIGIIEITQVLDGSNSKARIINQATGIKLEFGDIVRPI